MFTDQVRKVYSGLLERTILLREGTFFMGGVGRGILEIFCEKSRGPPTSQNGLMHDPSQIPTQKHLTLPPPPPRQKITGSEIN